MDENIVKQVQDIEAEADRIVAEAKQHAADLEESLESEIDALQKEREEALEGRLSELKHKLDEETSAQVAEIEQNAKEAMARLDSLDPQAVDGGLQLILERLQGQSGGSMQGEEDASRSLRSPQPVTPTRNKSVSGRSSNPEDGACQ